MQIKILRISRRCENLKTRDWVKKNEVNGRSKRTDNKEKWRKKKKKFCQSREAY